MNSRSFFPGLFRFCCRLPYTLAISPRLDDCRGISIARDLLSPSLWDLYRLPYRSAAPSLSAQLIFRLIAVRGEIDDLMIVDRTLQTIRGFDRSMQPTGYAQIPVKI